MSARSFNPLERIISTGGISGTIAIIIVAAIGGRYFLYGPEEVPQILGYALSTILGFYFGSGVSGYISDKGENSN
jgi:uncharacterized membrane protein YfcA